MITAVEQAVASHTAGSPGDEQLRWTNRSPRQIASELCDQGFVIGPDTVRRILTDELGLGRRQLAKTKTGQHFPLRNEQFEYLADLRAWYERQRWPVLSIDTKKKELLGEFFRPGRTYGERAIEVLDHDFPSQGAGRLVPYGVYDVVRNEALLLLTTSADTSQLACDALWRWWQRLGRDRYWHASGLLVLCDCGGSNGYRQFLFKEDLHRLACRLHRPIQVAHYPPGCSKYNPIEHRLFCHVTRALQGVVLRSVQVARDLIRQTTTSSGLRVLAEVARRLYVKGRHSSYQFLDRLPILFDDFLPELNYTALPYAQ